MNNTRNDESPERLASMQPFVNRKARRQPASGTAARRTALAINVWPMVCHRGQRAANEQQRQQQLNNKKCSTTKDIAKLLNHVAYN